MLDYGSGKYGSSTYTMSSNVCAILGFFAWIGAGIIICFTGETLGGRYFGLILIGAEVLAFFFLCYWVSFRLKWKGFIAGVMIGLLLTCLVPLGIVAVICGGWK